MIPQQRQIALDGIPDCAEIDGIIAVNERIAHAIGEVEPQLRMILREGWIGSLNLVGGLANDLEIADDGVLHERVLLERHLVEGAHITFVALDRAKDMLNIILYPQRLFSVIQALLRR
jgi:hypothetical protein